MVGNLQTKSNFVLSHLQLGDDQPREPLPSAEAAGKVSAPNTTTKTALTVGIIDQPLERQSLNRKSIRDAVLTAVYIFTSIRQYEIMS